MAATLYPSISHTLHLTVYFTGNSSVFKPGYFTYFGVSLDLNCVLNATYIISLVRGFSIKQCGITGVTVFNVLTL